MKELACLILVVLVAFAVAEAHDHVQGDEAMLIGMCVGTLMLGAWLAGMLFDRIHLPKISGYLLLGVLVGPYVLDIVSKQQVPNLRFANDLAVALIALTAGGEIRLDWLRGKLLRLLGLIGIDVIAIMSLGIGAIYFGRDFIPFLEGEPARTAFFAALVAGTVMIANSPTVVIAMISDYRASGPLTQMTLAFTICKDLVLIVLFATVTTVAKGALEEGTSIGAEFLLAVGVQLVGSIALGAFLGALIAWYVHRVGAHLLVFVIGSCLLFALLGDLHFAIAGQDVHLEPLLMALSAGMLIQNVWPDQGAPLFKTIESMSLPVYCLFFAIAGAKVDLGAFARLWMVAIVLVGLRAAAIWAAVTYGARLVGMREPWVGKLWLGMIPQAGVTLVLITVVGRAFDQFGWGRELGTLLIGMLVIHEMLGPVGFRHALFSSGEAGKAQPGATSH